MHSNILLLIPNELGTVFELGVQRLGTLERLEIQYLQATSEAGARNILITYRDIRITYLFACLLPFLYRCSPLYRNIYSTIVHRRTVHMWRWFHGLVFLILTETNKTGTRQYTRPFGVYLLKFTLDTHPGSLMHYLGLLEFPVRICDALHITTHMRRT